MVIFYLNLPDHTESDSSGQINPDITGNSRYKQFPIGYYDNIQLLAILLLVLTSHRAMLNTNNGDGALLRSILYIVPEMINYRLTKCLLCVERGLFFRLKDLRQFYSFINRFK